MPLEIEEINFGLEFLGKIINLGKVIEWIVYNMKPEDVFGYDALEEWALDNGFEEQQSRL